MYEITNHLLFSCLVTISEQTLIATDTKCDQGFENGLFWLLPGLCGLSSWKLTVDWLESFAVLLKIARVLSFSSFESEKHRL